MTWFPGPSLSAPLSGAATTVAAGGRNLLIGGEPDPAYWQGLAATNFVWQALTALPGVGVAPGAVANGDTVILYGGSDGTNATSTTIGYSPSGDPTLTLAPMSVARSDFGYAPDADGRAYAIGGLDTHGQPLSAAERYNPDLDTWVGIASLPTARYGFPAVFDGADSIYVFGGSAAPTVATATASVLRYSVNANTWTAMAPMPIPVTGSAAALGANGKFYVAGGISGGQTLSAVQVYDPAANSWTVSTPLPEGLSTAAMGVDSLGRLILMGGLDTNGVAVGDVWRSQQLGVPDRAPVFTLYPGTNAAYAVPYASSASASGNPQPTYLLISGPAGMRVDLYSGAIAWTPQGGQIGSNAITIRATNYAGIADWNFNVIVRPPPPTVPTNLTVTARTDSSVTLSWDPESPLVGPVTFSVYERHVAYGGRGGSFTFYDLVSGSNTNPTVSIGGLALGSSHAYVVTASVGGFTTARSAVIAATTTTPQSPASLQVVGLTSTSITIAWPPSPGPAQNPLDSPITSYSILQRIPGGLPSQVVTKVTGLSTTTGTVAGLVAGAAQWWEVQAVDAEGNVSTGTPAVCVTNP
ncbi:MAG: hypothetical protein KGS61_11995, partial [Verrucomicrobia bacterium]|nr:hypothetical protein [Verrucomicrobiota bacterium]